LIVHYFYKKYLRKIINPEKSFSGFIVKVNDIIKI